MNTNTQGSNSRSLPRTSASGAALPPPDGNRRISWSSAYDRSSYSGPRRDSRHTQQHAGNPSQHHQDHQQQHMHQQYMSESASVSFGGLSDALDDGGGRIQHEHHHRGYLSDARTGNVPFGGLSDGLDDGGGRIEHGHHHHGGFPGDGRPQPYHPFHVVPPARSPPVRYGSGHVDADDSDDEMMGDDRMMGNEEMMGGGRHGQDRHRFAGEGYAASGHPNQSPSGQGEHHTFSSSFSVADMSINSLSDAASMLEEVTDSAARRIFGHGGDQHDRQNHPTFTLSPIAAQHQLMPPPRAVNDVDDSCVDMATIKQHMHTNRRNNMSSQPGQSEAGTGDMESAISISDVGTGDMLGSVHSIGTFDMQSVHSHLSTHSHQSFGQPFHPRNLLTGRNGNGNGRNSDVDKLSSISGLTGSPDNMRRKPSTSLAMDNESHFGTGDDTSNVNDNDDSSSSTSHSNYGPIILLAVPEDSNALNELQCFIRQNVQVFSATSTDVDESLAARKRITAGQVGMRCIHCARLPPRTRADQAISYPPSIANIYQRVLIMGQVHFESCLAVPQDVAERFRILKASTSRVRFSRKYWIHAAGRIGLEDSGEGIRFRSGGGAGPMPFDDDGDSGDASATQSGPSRIRNPSTFPLVIDADRPLITEFQFKMMQQMQPCIFTENDTNKHGRRLDIRTGFAGLECRHCQGRGGLGKYFPVNAKRLREPRTHSAFTSHILKCNNCPQEVKNEFLALQKIHSDQSRKLLRGSQKEFFERVWGRLHQDDDEGQGGEDKTKPGGTNEGSSSTSYATGDQKAPPNNSTMRPPSTSKAKGKNYPSDSTWTR